MWSIYHMVRPYVYPRSCIDSLFLPKNFWSSPQRTMNRHFQRS